MSEAIFCKYNYQLDTFFIAYSLENPIQVQAALNWYKFIF